MSAGIRGSWRAVALLLVGWVGCSESVVEAPESAPVASRSAALEGGARLLRDVGGTPVVADSHPGRFVRVGGTLFFVAQEPSAGAELWKTDGTVEGTVRVVDLRPGAAGSELGELTPVGSQLYFVGHDGSTASGLWRTDGTAAGTVRVLAGPRSISRLAAVGSTLFFAPQEGTQDSELWRTDGTPEGTRRVRDIQPGPLGSLPGNLTAVGTTLFFTANDGVSGTELWRSDGTEEGTRRVRDISAGSRDTSISHLTAVGGTLFFSAAGANGHELWKSDGTEAGTVQVADINPGSAGSFPGNLVVLGNTLLFTANDGTRGTELWRSDGTGPGTHLVRDIQPGGGSSSIESPVVAGGLVFFPARDSAGTEPWRSDGTPEGTFRLRDIRAGDSSSPSAFVAVDNLVYFRANQGETGLELWVSDGSPAGTRLVRDIHPGTGSSGPYPLASLNGALFLTVWWNQPLGVELWRSDGTAEGTALFLDIAGESTPSHPRAFVQAGSLGFFRAEDSAGAELWRTDGTEAGTARVTDLNPGPTGSSPSLLTPLGGSLLFAASTDVMFGADLWRSDGTEEGTVLVADLVNPTQFTDVFAMRPTSMGWVFLTTNHHPSGGDDNAEPWRTDGTGPGTFRITDINAGAGSSFPSGATEWQGWLYFSAYTSSQGRELWRTTGNFGGTSLVRDIYPNSSTTVQSSSPHGFKPLGNGLYFFASDATDTSALWRTDGTSAGTVKVRSLCSRLVCPGDTAPGPGPLVELNGRLLFPAYDGDSTPESGGLELWLSDGSPGGTARLKDVFPGPTGSAPRHLVQVNGRGVFLANDGVHGLEPWVSDGTAEGTVLLRDVLPGPRGGAADQALLAVEDGGMALFAAYDDEAGMELWRTDGTPEGTRRLTDIAPGPRSSNPQALARTGAWVRFSADDGVHGREPWQLPVTVVMDRAPPGLTCPRDVTAEATGPTGAAVSYPEATVSDEVSAAPEVRYSRASGALFPLGATDVTVSARDEAGNTTSCTFRVTVRDTTAPVLTCPGDVTVEATGPAGDTVTYEATARDAVSGAVTPVYSRASGTVFPLGSTPVTVTAMDGAGNATSCAFSITVRDTTPPGILCPAQEVVAEATAPSGAVLALTAAAASDAVGTPTVEYSPASGSRFPPGATEVTATARDGAGLTASCTFTVRVRDSVAPALTCPVGLTVEATGRDGAPVAYDAATVSDAVTQAPVLVYSHVAGSVFSLGRTRVVVSAADAADNRSECAFDVTVRDTTAPAVTCPADVAVEATAASGAAVTFLAVTASDAVSEPQVRLSHASGAVFPVGVTAVRAVATDGGGNTAECGFRVTVTLRQAPVDDVPPGPRPLPGEDTGCGCAAGSPGASAGWGLLALLAWAGRRRRPA